MCVCVCVRERERERRRGGGGGSVSGMEFDIEHVQGKNNSRQDNLAAIKQDKYAKQKKFVETRSPSVAVVM